MGFMASTSAWPCLQQGGQSWSRIRQGFGPGRAEAIVANGWIDPVDNAAAVGSLSLGARRFASRLAKLHDVSRDDRRDADYRRIALLDRHDDVIALSLSCALVVADAIQGKPAAFKDKLSKEERWFARSAHAALHGMRQALSDPDIALLVETSDKHCASGILAADMVRPDGLHEAVTMLDGWTGELLARIGHVDTPGVSTLREAVELAGVLPCAVFAEGRQGFAVVITDIKEPDGDLIGFPTIGFTPADFWSRRRSWLQEGIVPDEDEAHWSVAAASAEVLEAAISDFRLRALPEMRQANASGMFVGSRKMAEALGVTVPRLAAWMRSEGLVVRGGDAWVPAPLLGRDSVLPKRDRMGRISWVWSPSFVEEIRPKAAEIALASPTRGPARLPPPPSDKQVAFLAKLHEELALPMPEEGYPTGKVASAAIETMLKTRRRAARRVAEPHDVDDAPVIPGP